MEKCEKKFMKLITIFLAVISLSRASAVAVTCDTEAPTDGRGVYIEDVDRYYSCRYLQEYLEEDQVGIFDNRIDHCKRPTTECCATCSLILGNQKKGIRIAETDFECKYLLLNNPEYSRLGIYKAREDLCSQDETKTNCRESCMTVASELEKDTEPASNRPAPKSAQTSTLPLQHTTKAKEKEPKEPKEPKELKDQCENDCLHIADGTMGKCEWLVDPERPEYDMRVFFCKNKFAAGCQKTCGDILKEDFLVTKKQTSFEGSPVNDKTDLYSSFEGSPVNDEMDLF